MRDNTPLRMKIEAMEPAQIVERFPHDLADDLIDQGMSAEDAEYVRQAAAVVMEICGLMQRQGMRRRKAKASSIEATQQKRAATLARRRQEQSRHDGPLNFAEHSTIEPDASSDRAAA